MNRPSRIAKRLVVPILLVVGLIVAGVVFAAPPLPSFEVDGPTANECGVYTFNSTSTDPDNDITDTTWNLGGTAASGPQVQATFGTPGPRIITMSVTDGSEGVGDLGPETIPAVPQTVIVANGGTPTAALTAPATAQPNETITFDATGSADAGSGSIASFAWDLDGNGTFDPPGAAGTQAVAFAAGTHTVNVQVTDNCGTSDTAAATVTVANNPPTASYTALPNPVAIGAAVTFDASLSTDVGGAIASYDWDFDGDGTFDATTTTPTTTHPYTAAGTYTTALQVTDSGGDTDTANLDVRVNAVPTAAFSYAPVAPLINTTVTFHGGASTDSDGTISAYDWDLDGNGTFETQGSDPTHVYAAAGTYNVKLRVTDNDGGVSAIVPRNVVIQATQPKAGFTYSPRDPLPGQQVRLTSTSTPSTSAAGAALVATQWDFGYNPLVDFTLDSNGGSVTTSFATPGAHRVAVKVTETGGGFAVFTDTIVVNAAPTASFTVVPGTPVEGREVTFASTSRDPDGPLQKQEWDLDKDGRYERRGAVVSTKKLKKGTRSVKLRVTDAKGATAVSTRSVKVKAKPLKPVIDVKRTIGFSRRDWGVVLVTLIVKVPAKTTVAVTCKGSGCPRGTLKKRSLKKRARLTFSGMHGSLRAGAKITVVTARTGHITAYDTYTIRGGMRSPLLREACRWGRGKPRACPS